MIPTPIELLAARFWDQVGGKPAPPRDLETVIWQLGAIWIWAGHPVTPDAVRARFLRRGIQLPPGTPDDRPLLGVVVAHRGRAEIAVDSELPPDIRRMIVAHELAHYLAEYLAPRERVLRRLGLSVLPVLDGDRPATRNETWAGLLAGVKLGVHTHFLERTFDPLQRDAHDRSERLANDLAFEILAPWREVLADGATQIDEISANLIEKYGLPETWVTGYARQLAALADRLRPTSARWGLR